MFSLNNDNLEKAKKILTIIGSPFNEPQNSSPDPFSFNELYPIAQKNKIGLFFLDSLAKRNQLTVELHKELLQQREAFETLQTTAERVAYIMNSRQSRYAIVKSNFPFPAVPNDVDLLILGNNKEYRKAIEYMRENHFEPVGKESKLEVCLHDAMRSKHFYDVSEKFVSKDPFDVDIYREIGAGHIIYMNKAKFTKDQFSQVTINNTKAHVLKPSSEMALSIFHSIYPERLYTLLLHLSILHTIKNMTPFDVLEFLRICYDNRMRNAMLIALSLTEAIQELCFGKSPRQVTDLREALGNKKQISIDRIPYRYPIAKMLYSFWGKKSDLIFALSFARQLLSLFSPRYVRYFIDVYNDRNKRDTY